MRLHIKTFFILVISWFVCCSNSGTTKEDTTTKKLTAEVSKVSISGNEQSYTFNVTIKSPDTGCQQYADWWEVIDLEENLIYRRVLAHSHVNEQPFSRSGGTINILKNQEVYIRAHMNNTGYGSNVLKGSVESGFIKEELKTSFAAKLENVAPLPNNCAF